MICLGCKLSVWSVPPQTNKKRVEKMMNADPQKTRGNVPLQQRAIAPRDAAN